MEEKDNPSYNNPWKVLGETGIYDNPWINVSHYDVLNPAGGQGIYGKVHFKNKAIGIVPIDHDGNTYLVGQYRFTIDQYSWEIPEGGGPLEEEALSAAKRELLEETGLKANYWQQIGIAHLSNSVTDELAVFFVAMNLTQHEAEPEETEQLVVKKVPLTTAFEMVENGIIKDGLSILCLQKVQLLLLQGKLNLSSLPLY